MAEDWLQGLSYIGNGDNGELLVAGFGSSIMSEVVVGSLADKPRVLKTVSCGGRFVPSGKADNI
ncbi:Molybdate-anion transporter [Trema orientale]|uniref:Molybdate-anion transporter n=1 Tax=Trema orientale TaxID=63057 RepID=A0A2P5E5U3_TREOI|nr:Molybdate-anion transporter [Trema orientale]